MSRSNLKGQNSVARARQGGAFAPTATPLFGPAPVPHRGTTKPPSVPGEGTALHSMVTAFLRDQHRSCANPSTTLPPLSLLKPHRCHDPVPTRPPRGVVPRIHRLQRGERGVGVWRGDDARLLACRMRPTKQFRDGADSHSLTSALSCIAFARVGRAGGIAGLAFDDRVVCGTSSGDLKVCTVCAMCSMCAVCTV